MAGGALFIGWGPVVRGHELHEVGLEQLTLRRLARSLRIQAPAINGAFQEQRGTDRRDGNSGVGGQGCSQPRSLEERE